MIIIIGPNGNGFIPNRNGSHINESTFVNDNIVTIVVTAEIVPRRCRIVLAKTKKVLLSLLLCRRQVTVGAGRLGLDQYQIGTFHFLTRQIVGNTVRIVRVRVRVVVVVGAILRIHML